MMSQDWKDRIVVMVYVKQELMKLDVEGLWPHHFPELAASEEELRRVEASLGYSLDKDYRGFLEMANGWKGFCQTVDLFGTHELLNSSIMQYAKTLLDAVEDDVINATGFSRSELLPIATTKYDKDLFVLSLPSSHAPGTVIWLAGEEVDRYPNFVEYYLAMIDYNRLLVEDMSKQNIK